jgi:hypothetical protein
MTKVETLLFEEPGPMNSEATFQAALRRAQELGITQFVIASATGHTALDAAKVLSGQGKVIGIHVSRGLWGKYCGPDPELVAEGEALGVTFIPYPHGLTGAVDAALAQLGGLPGSHVIAHTLCMFCPGMKVAVEDVLMAADVGLLRMDQEVISLAGTTSGADTAIVVTPAYPSECFSLRVHEILAKPR